MPTAPSTLLATVPSTWTKLKSEMTFEERIDKLTGRHEALTQTVEIIAGMQRDNEGRMAKIEDKTAQLTETMNRLANIVIVHDQHLDDLEH